MGGREEIDARVEEVKKLVWCAVKPYFGKRGYEIDDLMQEGLLGVMVNGDSYDPERGSLSTFVTTVAQTWLLGRVFQADARNCRRVNFEAMSLDEPLKRDSDHGEARTLAELIPDETNLEAELIWRSDVERAHRLLDRLDTRTADVLRRRFSDEPDTLQDIADDLGCTKEWVRQIEERGLKRLRNMFGK